MTWMRAGWVAAVMALLSAVLLCSTAQADELLAQWKASRPNDYPTPEDYLRVLSRWPAYAEGDWQQAAGDPSMARYGPGDSGWGMMCHASAMFCYALLATDPGYDATASGVSRERLLEQLNRGLKYMTRCHATGDINCSDGKQWSTPRGHWHSATWAENMGAAADLAWDRITPENRDAVRRVLAWEAERLSEEAIPSGSFADSKAESNAWDASVLARAAAMFPEHPQAGKWHQKAIEWAMNTLSAPQDAEDDTLVDGKPVKEWVHTVNVHRSFAIENHGYYHVCYMWWPMWCLSSAYYSYRSHDRPAPQALFHHWKDCFQVLKRCYLADGRFAYVGGKDWPRYVYGLTAAMPCYVLLQTVLNEPVARTMEREAFARYEWEQQYNGDGSFLGKRLAELKRSGARGYQAYCRYEADQAIMLGLAYRLHRLVGTARPPANPRAELVGSFECPEAEMVLRQDPQRFVSWCWKTRTRLPQGIVALPDDPHLCEWDGNLCGSIAVRGDAQPPAITVRRHGLTQRGLWAVGELQRGPMVGGGDAGPLSIELADDTTRPRKILRPEHPIFNTPNKITDVTALSDPDNITAAGPGWTVLVENNLGKPSIMEAQVGQGKILVCMSDADSQYTAGTVGGTLFENLLKYAESYGPKPVAYVPAQNSVAAALAKAGRSLPSIGSLGSADLSPYSAVIVDRGVSPEPQSSYWKLRQFAEQGGLVVCFCLQDAGWNVGNFSDAPRHRALVHHIGLAALPDGRTTVFCERAVATGTVTVERAAGLNLKVANDLYNDYLRTYYSAERSLVMRALQGEDGPQLFQSNWLNVDNKLGVVIASGEAAFNLDAPDQRNAPYQSLCVQTVTVGAFGSPKELRAGNAALSEVAILLTPATAEETAKVAQQAKAFLSADGLVLGVWVPMANGQAAAVAFNFSDKPGTITVDGKDLAVPPRSVAMPE